MHVALLTMSSSCGAGLAAKECTPQTGTEVLVGIALAILALIVLLLLFNRITRRWANSDEMATALLAPIARLIRQIAIPWPSKDPRDYQKPGRWERR
jgi:hypothetical protein